MLEHLKQCFYHVMYKYEKPFGEIGVLANLELWQQQKASLLQLLKNHPCWQEKELAIVFPVSEVRGIDHDIVDETKFELLALAREILADTQQYNNFQNALNAVTADYSRIPDESRLESIRQYGNIKCAPGQKASRIINRLCQQFGIDRYEADQVTETDAGTRIRHIRPYNAIFARLADALNPVEIQKTAVLSIHPCDFLEMSNKDNIWHSCHCLADGSWKGGCQSYMGDSVSMIFFTVDEDITCDFYMAPRLTRQIFCYQDGLLLQSRLYPNDNADLQKLYRSIVQNALSLCLDSPNLWSNKQSMSEISEYWETPKHANHYKDYEHDYANLSFLKSQTEYGRLTIGSIARCTCCGGEQTDHHSLNCSVCTPTVVCKDCGQTVPWRQAAYVDHAFYCDQCTHTCASCRELVHGTVYPAFDRQGNLTAVCSTCYQRIVEPCAQCNVNSICSLIHARKHCPYTAVA